MRLTAQQIETIRQNSAKHFGANTHIWLFGSRATYPPHRPRHRYPTRMNTELKAMFARCKLHAARLAWAKSQLAFPLDTEKINHLDNVQLVILELVKEPTEQQPFIDKLHRLEKIAAIPSADQWLLQREIRKSSRITP